MRILGFLCAAIVFSGLAWSQQQFPNLPGKDAMITACSGCHEPERALSLREDKAGWEALMTTMSNRGMELTDADYATVLGYLSKAFPAPAVKPLNINTAEAIEMESALSLLRSQASAIVAYREKYGKFKTLDDLKKIPGLDFAKIEAQKARITF